MNKLTQAIAGSMIACAAISPVMATGFSGDMQFNGTITNTMPEWVWQLDAAAQTENGALNFDQANAKVEADNLTWEHVPTSSLWLMGHLNKIVFGGQNGGRTINPQISFGGTLLTGTESPITITTADNAGILTITAFGVASRSMKTSDTSVTTYVAKYTDAAGTTIPATHVLQTGPAYMAYLTQAAAGLGFIDPSQNLFGPGINYDDFGTSTSGGWWAGADQRLNFAGAYVTKVKLSYPKTSVPATWSATLPITVAIQ